MFPLLAGISIALSAAVAAGLPRIVLRLAVEAGSEPRGGCPCCAEPFRRGWRGWLATGSRCSACAGRLGVPWWAYGGIAAVGAAMLVWRLPTSQPAEICSLAAWLFVIQVGLLLSGIDVAVQRLPTRLVMASALVITALIAVSAVLEGAPHRLSAALAAAATLGAFYLVLALGFGSQMGMGDVRVAAMLGLLLGTSGWNAVLVGAVLPYVLAAPVGVLRLAHDGSTRRGDHLPFGPFLFAGAFIAAVLVG